jgi:hypothetical protein
MKSLLDLPMVKLTSTEKAELGSVPDYMRETLPQVANGFFVLMRRQMGQNTRQAALSAIQMVINLADSDDIKRQICAWIMAGKIA